MNWIQTSKKRLAVPDRLSTSLKQGLLPAPANPDGLSLRGKVLRHVGDASTTSAPPPSTGLSSSTTAGVPLTERNLALHTQAARRAASREIFESGDPGLVKTVSAAALLQANDEDAEGKIPLIHDYLKGQRPLKDPLVLKDSSPRVANGRGDGGKKEEMGRDVDDGGRREDGRGRDEGRCRDRRDASRRRDEERGRDERRDESRGREKERRSRVDVPWLPKREDKEDRSDAKSRSKSRRRDERSDTGLMTKGRDDKSDTGPRSAATSRRHYKSDPGSPSAAVGNSDKRSDAGSRLIVQHQRAHQKQQQPPQRQCVVGKEPDFGFRPTGGFRLPDLKRKRDDDERRMAADGRSADGRACSEGAQKKVRRVDAMKAKTPAVTDGKGRKGADVKSSTKSKTKGTRRVSGK
ncbi:hypothetical protein HK101_011500, partial [Irineochytrium annulatum]